MNTNQEPSSALAVTHGSALDLRTCKPGDKLLSIHGEILEYVGVIGGDYPHEIRYSNGSRGTRLDNGWCFRKNRLPTDHDIAAILPNGDSATRR
jgi:hypothetical protein